MKKLWAKVTKKALLPTLLHVAVWVVVSNSVFGLLSVCTSRLFWFNFDSVLASPLEVGGRLSECGCEAVLLEIFNATLFKSAATVVVGPLLKVVKNLRWLALESGLLPLIMWTVVASGGNLELEGFVARVPPARMSPGRVAPRRVAPGRVPPARVVPCRVPPGRVVAVEGWDDRPILASHSIRILKKIYFWFFGWAKLTVGSLHICFFTHICYLCFSLDDSDTAVKKLKHHLTFTLIASKLCILGAPCTSFWPTFRTNLRTVLLSNSPTILFAYFLVHILCRRTHQCQKRQIWIPL